MTFRLHSSEKQKSGVRSQESEGLPRFWLPSLRSVLGLDLRHIFPSHCPSITFRLRSSEGGSQEPEARSQNLPGSWSSSRFHPFAARTLEIFLQVTLHQQHSGFVRRKNRSQEPEARSQKLRRGRPQLCLNLPHENRRDISPSDCPSTTFRVRSFPTCDLPPTTYALPVTLSSPVPPASRLPSGPHRCRSGRDCR
jgi:hypothetical protein